MDKKYCDCFLRKKKINFDITQYEMQEQKMWKVVIQRGNGCLNNSTKKIGSKNNNDNNWETKRERERERESERE